MAIYLVGPTNKALFSKQSTWNFIQALEDAKDGDTIEIQDGFCPFDEQNGKSIVVKKNITIQGHARQEDDGILFTTVIDGVCVKNGANVILKDICVRKGAEKQNCINVKENSSLTVENVLIENIAQEGENYPIVFISGQSNVTFRTVCINPSAICDGTHKVYAENSHLKVMDSFIGAKMSLQQVNLHCEESTISNFDNNALFATDNSTITLKSVVIEGGKIGEKSSWPCVKCISSQLTCEEITVSQPGYNKAFNLVSCNVNLIGGEIEAIDTENTQLNISETEVAASFAIHKNSQLNATDLYISGKDNGRINLYASGSSSIKAASINFRQLSTPNIKLERNVEFSVEKLKLLGHDQQPDWVIEYFGDRTAYQRLNEMIGIKNVKSDIEEFIAIAQMNKKREEQGLSSSALTLHSLFLGNPGTGKTTVARIVGEILYEKRIIPKNIYVEVSRSGLVGQYIGETALKTRKVLESALGGVLFIDEAYTLSASHNSKNDFGLEAINEILKFMEDHRKDIVIIFAGYTNDMMKFLEMNDGLKSRIPNSFTFDDYTMDELIEIGLIDLQNQNYNVDKDAYSDLVNHNFELSNDFSNGRWVRNLNERIIRKLAIRISKDSQADITLITREDLLAARL